MHGILHKSVCREPQGVLTPPIGAQLATSSLITFFQSSATQQILSGQPFDDSYPITSPTRAENEGTAHLNFMDEDGTFFNPLSVIFVDLPACILTQNK